MAESARVFEFEGYVLVRNEALVRQVDALRSAFEAEFLPRFGGDAGHNRNLVKRFADTPAAAGFFCEAAAVAVAALGTIETPVFCGPIVTHYTSNDFTGRSYGLPFHQDWPSMASSLRSLILWVGLRDTDADSHGLVVVPGRHKGLLPGTQSSSGYCLDEQHFPDARILRVRAGELLLMSPFLPHRTYIHPTSRDWKLSLSRRIDDLADASWAVRGFANAYETTVNRDLFRGALPSA